MLESIYIRETIAHGEENGYDEPFFPVIPLSSEGRRGKKERIGGSLFTARGTIDGRRWWAIETLALLLLLLLLLEEAFHRGNNAVKTMRAAETPLIPVAKRATCLSE